MEALRRRAGRILAGALLAALFTAGAHAEPRAVRAEVEPIDAVARGPSVEARLAEIRRRIQRVLEYPSLARSRGLEGTTRIQFEVRRDGEAAGVRVAGSSGHWLLDRAAERCVRRAAPLPWVHGRLEVPVRFALDD